MDPRLDHTVLGETYRRYKGYTEIFVNWQVQTARTCDCHPTLLDTTQSKYPLDIDMYLQVALAITRSVRFKGVPEDIMTALNNAIADRNIVYGHYKDIGKADEMHLRFINILIAMQNLFSGYPLTDKE